MVELRCDICNRLLRPTDREMPLTMKDHFQSVKIIWNITGNEKSVDLGSAKRITDVLGVWKTKSAYGKTLKKPRLAKMLSPAGHCGTEFMTLNMNITVNAWLLKLLFAHFAVSTWRRTHELI